LYLERGQATLPNLQISLDALWFLRKPLPPWFCSGKSTR
jgi:hypothetical protein